MKVLGICGSHRKGSNSMFFLQKALAECEKVGLKTEAVELCGMRIEPCTVCGLCAKEYACGVRDDAFSILRKMEEADALVIASPTYYAMVSGKLKNLFDRTLPLRRNGMKLSGKVCGAVAVGASRNGGQEFVCGQILRWAGLHEMVAVTDRKTAHFGGIAWVPRGTQPSDDTVGTETCENLGRKVAQTVKALSGVI